MSASKSRRQVFFGLPLFLLPWGFHVRTCLIMFVLGSLKVWPSHPHLLLRISISIWAWCVLSQRSLLLTLSIQCIRRILRRQWLTNVWILISVVFFIRHVSAPYSNTDFTFVLIKRIFVVLQLPLTSTHFSKGGKLPLLCWSFSLRQLLSVHAYPLCCLDI